MTELLRMVADAQAKLDCDAEEQRLRRERVISLTNALAHARVELALQERRIATQRKRVDQIVEQLDAEIARK